jgi:hypothetical protein
MTVRIGDEMWTVPSDKRSRRHGVTWTDVSGRGGLAGVCTFGTARIPTDGGHRL